MNSTIKITLIIALFAAITLSLLFISGILTGIMDTRWLMGNS